MTAFRRLEGYTPPERNSALITLWRIEEAATPTDADAVTIEGPTLLSPPVTNPAAPPTYTFETYNAALSQGWYRVVWTDDNGGDDPTGWVALRTLSPYAPTVADIATILRARAVELGGWRVDTFTDRTNPTAQNVQQTIIMFAPIVLARLGRLDNLGCFNAEDLRAAATGVVAQRVALEVEAAYWPEEVVEAASVEARRQSLDTDLEGLVKALEACRASNDDGGNGPDSDSPSDPAWRYPAATPLRY